MGASGTPRGRAEDTVMEEKKKTEVTPYRMARLIKTASDVAQLLTSGKYVFPAPTFEECLIILDIVRDTIMKTDKEET